MRALQLQRLEGPDGLAVVNIPEPEAGDGVLIDVVAAGASFPDLLLTRGLYQMQPPLPFVPGVEVAGVVRSAPAGASVRPGDRVMAFTFTLGGFAEVVAVAPEMTFRIPERWSFEAAAGVVMNYHTAHFALHRRGRLKAGEVVVVHGAAGGVGTAAVQVARGAGAKVLAVVSDERKAEVAQRAGAHESLLSTGDWISRVRELTDGRGADVVLDPVGGDIFDKSLKCLAPEGRLLVVGFASGRIPEVTTNRLLLRNIDVVGVAWGAFLLQDPGLTARIAGELESLAARGILEPLVGQVYPLEEGAQALRDLEARRATGKLVLRIR
ncbi:NADPH:quinone oxidoreductase family protein [Corallococcus sp. H22C18031201]|uniref:NADPH:quinone oxidoreductase family protein n=1 Tax=Citreicoccus inhibens TaxID=2849499 RepID=UPI000E716457|nr:NADPH:quinone oxidoreductase family protein [Citreicoccus inhibens]MBU8895260.1 NADPH:quinone oxidoreductase family protein [Citreicoccus inhibens]RJS26160.1 NADPH:quinone oxidoreductase family protein [Corallococcus sp. H22C18031201]